MPNVKFSYGYRDGSNYKKHDFVVFDNSVGIELSDLEHIIRQKSIFGEYFYATAWGLPEFFTDYVDFRIDPTWHEFECVEYTDEPPNAPMDLAEFIDKIK